MQQRGRTRTSDPDAAVAAAAASSSSRPCRGTVVAAAVGGAVALAIVMCSGVAEWKIDHRDSGWSAGVIIRAALRHGDQQQQQQQRRARQTSHEAATSYRKQDEQMPDEVREECDCFRHSDSPACCQRSILRDHKFGTQLTEKLFKPVPAPIDRVAINVGAFPSNPFQDYRHVAVVRNLSEALVSGYLYHKTGHECWLNYNGGVRLREKVQDWDPFLNRTTHLYDLAPYPPRNGRSICRYLADEPEEVGMKVYVGVALLWWYGGLNDYYRMAKERQIRGETQRTKFLCIENYPDAASQERMFYEIMDWLYPGGHNVTVPPGVLNDDPDHGGHATSHNVTERTRTRLLELVHRLDREVFRNSISATEAHFGCPGTVSRNR